MPNQGWRAGWRTSTRTNNGTNCVEVDFTTDSAELRDTKDHGAGPVLHFTPAQWSAFLHEVLADLPSSNGAVEVSHRGDRTVVVALNGTLVFTRGEWAAFLAGVHDGEFDYHTQVATAPAT
ncbi:MAG: DUF397 domain-containing protein [Pseudonocardiaceae bacterium]|nr:DUF397 domain-containing protein [Pseudonocardiaceae bacterium]